MWVTVINAVYVCIQIHIKCYRNSGERAISLETRAGGKNNIKEMTLLLRLEEVEV